MIKLGSHVSFKAPDYLLGSAKEAISYGSNTMMIYLGPPQNTIRASFDKYKLNEYREKFEHVLKPEDILVHAPYIVNPASPEKWRFARDFLISEIERMNFIGAKYLVLHPGAHTKFSRGEAIDTLVKTIKEIINHTKNVHILLETMAGKGTELGTSFYEMSLIIKKIDSTRVGVCLDTCHVWESGINIKSFDLLISELNHYDLLKKIKAIHVNDSKNLRGAKKDRHENIDQGQIGLKALKKIVHAPEFDNVIKILETPWVNGKPIYKQEIKWLK